MFPYSIADIQSFVAMLYGGKNITVAGYVYPMTFSALAQGASATQQLGILSNADFLFLGMSHRANIAAAQQVSSKTSPFVRILLTDSSSGEQLMSAAVDLENYSSNDGKIRAMGYPRLLQGRSSLTVTLTSYAPTAETYSIDLAFHGAQIRVY